MRLTVRQEAMLRALGDRPCATLGPVDLVDQDYAALVRFKLVHEYWGSGGIMCAITDAGRRYHGLEPVTESGVTRWVKPSPAPHKNETGQ